jgi:hypothetical protein
VVALKKSPLTQNIKKKNQPPKQTKVHKNKHFRLVNRTSSISCLSPVSPKESQEKKKYMIREKIVFKIKISKK